MTNNPPFVALCIAILLLARFKTSLMKLHLGVGIEPLQVEHRIMIFNLSDRLQAFLLRSDSLDLDCSRSRAPSKCIQMIIYTMQLTDLFFWLQKVHWGVWAWVFTVSPACIAASSIRRVLNVWLFSSCLSVQLSLWHTQSVIRYQLMFSQFQDLWCLWVIHEVYHNHKVKHTSTHAYARALVVYPAPLCSFILIISAWKKTWCISEKVCERRRMKEAERERVHL